MPGVTLTGVRTESLGRFGPLGALCLSFHTPCLSSHSSSPSGLYQNGPAGLVAGGAGGIGETKRHPVCRGLKVFAAAGSNYCDDDFTHAATSGLFAGARVRQVAERSLGKTAGFLAEPQ